MLIAFFSTLIQFVFWGPLFQLLKIPEKSNLHNGKGVSVIVCAHDEAKNIINTLPKILTQSYKPYEVVFVNDASTDHTEAIIKRLQLKYPHLRLVSLPFSSPGKKEALEAGVRAAKYTLLVLSDADCTPVSNQWLKHMVDPLIQGKEIVLGFAPLYSTSQFINLFIRYDGIQTFLLYAALALKGTPFMGVGRNLAYTKSIYTHRDSIQHRDLIGGDDDLLINESAHAHNTAVVFHKDSFTISHAKASWATFFKQKRRHVSVSWRYKKYHQWILLFFAASHWFHYLSIVILLFSGFTILAIFLYLIRLVFIIIRFKTLFDHIGYNDLFRWIPVLDAFYFCYYPIIDIFLLQKPPRHW